MSTIRIVLAEDHHVVRAGIAAFLGSQPDIEVVGQVAGGDELARAVDTLAPDLLVLDAHLPGHNAIETARALRDRHPSLRILVLSAYDRREYVVGLLGAGALGYVLKDDPPEALVEAVRAVARGRRWLSPRVAHVVLKSAFREAATPLDELSEREAEVLRLMASGYRNERIAQALDITEQTVKNHVRSIFSKLGVETRVEAVLYAVTQGWVHAETPEKPE